MKKLGCPECGEDIVIDDCVDDVRDGCMIVEYLYACCPNDSCHWEGEVKVTYEEIDREIV